VFGVVLCVVFVAIALAATAAWRPLGVWLGGRLEHGRASHAQGTIGLLVGSALAFAPLVLLGGQAPLSALLGDTEADLVGGAMAQAAEQLYMLAWAGMFAIWAAAWPTHVYFSRALQRLGLGPIARRDVPWIVGMTLVAVGVGFAGDFLTGALIDALGWPRTDAELLDRLLPAAKLPLGALIIAVGAGVSEELVVRGLLQPRFGWLPANLAFVSAHAFQYGVDGLLVVFMGGALLAFVRWRWNTTAAIAVHTGYDLILLGIGLLST
jgi:membrane protease YdiL (CAAX protease family)